MVAKTILIISNPQDSHTKFIAEKIDRNQFQVILFYPEMLGQQLFFSSDNTCNQKPFSPTIVIANKEISINEVYSIWYRRPRPILPALANEAVSAEGIEFARSEWEAVVDAINSLTGQPLWVSHPDYVRIASRKPLQLVMAKRLGLKTPLTLITNQPDKARAFFRLCKGKVIVKPTGYGWFRSTDGSLKNVYTNRITLDDIESHLDEIKTAPITFQEEIPKLYEIRANVVGQKVLAVRIDSQKSRISELDWRKYDLENTPYSAYCLPEEIEIKCLKLAWQLGLEYGALDLIYTPDREYIFLEINPGGQFVWAEKLSGVKISDALVQLLTGESEPLKNMNFC